MVIAIVIVAVMVAIAMRIESRFLLPQKLNFIEAGLNRIHNVRLAERAPYSEPNRAIMPLIDWTPYVGTASVSAP